MHPNQAAYLEAESARLAQQLIDQAEQRADRDREELDAMLAELNQDLEREAA
jgi:hypothetical protein